MTSFVVRMRDRAGIGVFEAGAGKLLDETLETDALVKVLEQFTPRTRPPIVREVDLDDPIRRFRPTIALRGPGQAEAGLLAAAGDVVRALSRRRAVVLVMFGASGDGWSDRALEVFTQVRESGAVIYAVLFVPAEGALGVALADETRAEQLIAGGALESGGRRLYATLGEDIGSILNEFAADLTHQYAVSYSLPNGVRPSSRIKVSLRRPNATLRAPTRVPDR